MYCSYRLNSLLVPKMTQWSLSVELLASYHETHCLGLLLRLAKLQWWEHSELWRLSKCTDYLLSISLIIRGESNSLTIDDTVASRKSLKVKESSMLQAPLKFIFDIFKFWGFIIVTHSRAASSSFILISFKRWNVGNTRVPSALCRLSSSSWILKYRCAAAG